MTETTDRHPPPRTHGLLVHAAARYDFLVWLLTLGRERATNPFLRELATNQ